MFFVAQAFRPASAQAPAIPNIQLGPGLRAAPLSARDASGVNIALLTCRAFAVREPVGRQTWRLGLNAHGVRAVCDFPDAHLEFTRGAFSGDPRVRGLRWERG